MTSGQPCALPLGREKLRQVGNRRKVVPGRPSAAGWSLTTWWVASGFGRRAWRPSLP